MLTRNFKMILCTHVESVDNRSVIHIQRIPIQFVRRNFHEQLR